ncbi:hypothetical protein [Lentibacillus halodurans]|nr:hypothetical protein [Lentibacillus halodurans]
MLLAKRSFDFFSVAYISACIYFLPGFFDYTLTPRTYNTSLRYQVDIHNEVYLIMIILLSTIWIGAFFFDRSLRNKARNRIYKIEGSQYSAVIATVIAVLGFFLTLSTTGGALFSPDKHAMMEEINRFYKVWYVGASVGSVLSFTQKKWKLFVICIFLIGFDVFIGQRESLATVMISIITITLFSKGKVRLLLKHWKVSLIGLFCGTFVFVYKYLYKAIKRFDLEYVMDSLTSWDFYVRTISESEPFTTQHILNEVVRQDFTVEMSHLADVIYQFIIFSSQLGAETTTFNDLFQPALFPDARAGMAHNFWAQMWSSGGWLLLITSLLIFILIISIGSYFIYIADPTLKAGLTLFMAYLSFYIHRTDLMWFTTVSKRVILLFLFCLLVSIVFYELVVKSKKPNI